MNFLYTIHLKKKFKIIKIMEIPIVKIVMTKWLVCIVEQAHRNLQ